MARIGILCFVMAAFSGLTFGQTPEQTQAIQTCFAAIQQKRETVLNVCNEAVSKAPTINDAHRLRGVANLLLNNFEAAIADFSKASQLAPTDLEAILFRGETYQRQVKYPEAIAEFSKLLQLQPKSLIALLRRSQAYESSFRRDLAIADLKAILAIQPNDPTATKALNDLQEKAKPVIFEGRQLTSAEMILQVTATYLEANSLVVPGMSFGVTKNTDYYNLLITCVVRFPGSLKCNEKLVEEYGISQNEIFTGSNLKPWVKNNLLFIYSNIIQLNPTSAAAFRGRGAIFAEGNLTELALADYTKAIAIDPKRSESFRSRAKAYVAMKKYELALADYTKAVELADSFWKYYTVSDRLELYKLQQNWTGVVSDATELIRLDPKMVRGHYERGRAYNQQKQWSAALTDLTNTIQLQTTYDDAFFQRAIAHRGLGKNDLAEADEKRAAELKKRRESGGKN